LVGTLVGSFLGLLEAIGFALDGEDLGVVDQAIDQGDDAGGVWKDLAPFGEGPVGGEWCFSSMRSCLSDQHIAAAIWRATPIASGRTS
jgi:hypothetical protein